MVRVETERKLGFLYRSRIDIIANILRVAIGGAKKTHIMYKCNLSFKQLRTYLDLVLEGGLLREVPEKGSNSNLFETTLKGNAFLQAYETIETLLIV